MIVGCAVLPLVPVLNTVRIHEGYGEKLDVLPEPRTVIGVGQDFGQGLGLALSELRGGNYYFLGDRDEGRRVFGEELAFMVTPVAFDVDMEIVVQDGFELTGVYGVPTPEGTTTATRSGAGW